MPTELHDKAHIDLFDSAARQHWAHRFGVSEERLRKAVRMVGSRVPASPPISASQRAEPMDGHVLDPETHPPLSGDQIGVLVAEDDALLLADMARALSAAGIAAFGVGDADHAVRALAWRNDIRVLITDVGMPSGGVNGFQLAAMVAARWPQLGILVVSGGGRPQPGDLPMGVRFLPKPCRDPDLVAAVFGFVSRQTGAI